MKDSETGKFLPSNKTIWFPDEIIFLIKEFHNYTNPELLAQINSLRSKKITLTVLRDKCRELKLLHEQRPAQWLERETSFLIHNYQKLGNVEMANRLNKYKNRSREFNVKSVWKKMQLLKLKRSPSQLQLIKEINIKNGRYAAPRCGERHHNYHKENSKWIVKHSGGRKYWFIKIGGKILFLHRYRYQLEFGEILPGNVVSFKDGDTLNCRKENLYQCKRGKHSTKKQSNFNPDDPFLTRDKLTRNYSVPSIYSVPSYSHPISI